MRLHEIAGEFDDPAETPVQAYDRVVNREKALDMHALHMYQEVNRLIANLQSDREFPQTPEDQTPEGIAKRKAEGWYVLMNGKDGVQMYFKITPQNQQQLKHLSQVNKMYLAAQAQTQHNKVLIKRYKAKHQASVRKDPSYINRDEGKDLGKVLADGAQAFCQSLGISPVNHSGNFWKKGNKFVVELGFTEKPQNNVTLWNKLKAIVPKIKEYFTAQGIAAGNPKMDYIDRDNVVVKFFIDAQDVKKVDKTPE